jgi:hypothetical protein
MKDNNMLVLDAISAEFDQCFLNQLQNVVASIQGTEPLVVSGESGLRSLKAMDDCYFNRQLMDMPWLAERDNLRVWQKDIQPK